MTREIPLSRGQVAIVDDADFEWLTKWKWQAHPVGRNRFYAVRSTSIRGRTINMRMHRLIMDAPQGMQVDHINHDRLDNRRENLRLCTVGENTRNRRNFSPHGFKGVYPNVSGSWRATIGYELRRFYLGTFATAAEAARAYDRAAVKLHGEFANLNFPEAA
jgi:hypothetical protein